MDLVTGSSGHVSLHAPHPIHAAIFGSLVRCVAERARSQARTALPGSAP
jgi:hypothetical protein